MSELLDCDQVLSKGTLQSINKTILKDEIAKQYRILTSFPEEKPRNSNKTKTVEFKFHLSPSEFIGQNKITGLKFKKNLPSNEDYITINAGLVISAIGYQGDEIVGLKSDELGMIVHKNNIIENRK